MSDPMVQRRTVLGGLGTGVTAPFFGSRIVTGMNRSTRITVGRAGTSHEAVASETVPKDWLKHQRTLRRVTDRLREQYEQREYVGSVSYVATERMKDGVYFAQPEIAVKPGTDKAKRHELPDAVEETRLPSPADLQISDIRIREMNGEFVEQDVDCYRGVTESTFPGGLEIQDSESDLPGTGGFKVWNGNNEYLITANHLLQDGDCSVAGAGANDASGDLLGYTVDGHKTHDWVTVSDENTTYSNKIQYEEGTTTLDGYATKNGMDSIQGQKGTLQFQGIVSGKQDAYVKGGGASVDTSGCIKMYGSAAKIGMPEYARGGDSGGPYWWDKGKDQLAVGVHSASEVKGSFSACGLSGDKGRPCYVYPFWRISNNTNYTVKDV